MNAPDLIASFKKQPVGFACALLCVVLGALLYFRGAKVTESQATYTAKSAEAANIIANVRNSENLPKQVTEIQALAKDMDSRLIRPGQLAVNLQYFYKLEAENEVKLLDIRQGTPPKTSKSAYVGIPYAVSIQGSFKQVVAFINKLQSGQHFCHFSSVTFSKATGSSTDSSGAVAENMTINLNLELLGLP
jgi:Tfp pilus assembly protein PilO